MITPERTMPMPPPTPRIAESRPIPPATFSRGNSSRTMPKASGKMPPATPWMKRAAICSARVAGDGGDQGAEGEDDERPEQQPLLAVHVAEPADDRGADRGGEQVAGEEPGDPGLVGAELAHHRRQGRDHQRAQHRVGEPAEREHGEGDVGMGALGEPRAGQGPVE